MRKYRRNPPVKRSFRWVQGAAAEFNLVDVQAVKGLSTFEDPNQTIYGYMAMGKFPLDNYSKEDREAILELCMDKATSETIEDVNVLIMFDERRRKELFVPFAVTFKRDFENEDQVWTIFYSAVKELGRILDQFEPEDVNTKRGRNWDLDLEPLPKLPNIFALKRQRFIPTLFTKLPETFGQDFGGERWAGMCGVALDPEDFSEETIIQLQRKTPVGATVWKKLPRDLDYALLHEIGINTAKFFPWLLIEPDVVDWMALPQEIAAVFVNLNQKEDDPILDRFGKLEYNPRRKRR